VARVGRLEELFPGVARLYRSFLMRLERRRRARQHACLRCGARATSTCVACGARICASCGVLSIETGEVSTLCLDCTSAPRAAVGRVRSLAAAPHLFRDGARTLGWMLLAAAAVAYWRRGWAGPRQIAVMLLEPAVTFALVPLAFLIGAVRAGLGRALRAFLSAPSDRAR
jgi:hypothetical protein